MSERKRNYPTGSADGMEFICNRWTFTGPKGWGVRPNDDGTFRVVSYNVAEERVAGPNTLSMTEDDAHAYAASLAKTTPHPKEGQA